MNQEREMYQRTMAAIYERTWIESKATGKDQVDCPVPTDDVVKIMKRDYHKTLSEIEQNVKRLDPKFHLPREKH